MPTSLISLGANLGNTYETMLTAAQLLIEQFGPTRARFSRLYQTPAVGGPEGQSNFLNAMVAVDSELTCWEVWEAIKRIESELGRQRMQRWEARRIDIDLILHGQERIWTPHLKVPHPRMCMRTFVLEPANEIAPNIVDPVTGWSIQRLQQHLGSPCQNPILAVCNRPELASSLERDYHAVHATPEGPPPRFVACEAPAEIAPVAKRFRAHLLVACVQTPDPESIQWEDFSYPWASALGLTPNESQDHLEGPRYLLPANDRAWAIHEIQAAQQAMHCPIQASELCFPAR